MKAYLYDKNTNKEFTSYLDFIYNFKGNSKDLSFHYWDDIFSQYDWKQEPEENYEHLLATRAQQIRDSYNYIRMYFSGGADSTTMLSVFVDNNLFVDEIIVYRISLIDNFDKSYPLHREVSLSGEPFLQKILLRMPNTKIVYYDIDSTSISNYLDNKLWLDDPHAFNWDGTLRGLCQVPIEYLNPTYTIVNKHYCNLGGFTKPTLRKINNKYYVIHGSSEYLRFCKDFLPFFTSPELPELHIKQCHLVKNYFKKYYPECPENVLINDGKVDKIRKLVEQSCRYSYDSSFITQKNTKLLSGGKNAQQLKEGFLHNRLLYEKVKETITYIIEYHPKAFYMKEAGSILSKSVTYDLGE